MTTQAPVRNDTEKDALAASLLRGCVSGCALPPHLSGTSNVIVSALAASKAAPELLETLAEVYDVRDWDFDAFRRVFVEGAFAYWKLGTRVLYTGSRFRGISPRCPVGWEVQTNARVCQMCRALTKQAAQTAIAVDVEESTFDQFIARGDAVCAMTIKTTRRV